MAEVVYEYDCECNSCQGTGVYCGVGERDGAGIVCQACKGKGQRHITVKYRTPSERKKRDRVTRIYETNPGFIIGNTGGDVLETFGGMPYDSWLAGEPFEDGMENRKFTCPAWWYQSADYDRKPEWDDDKQRCGFGSFSNCAHFGNKAACWKRFDAETLEKKNG